MLKLSRRARELGTENAFVVLGEVAKLIAEGKNIVSFCIGQPDFPTPEHIRMAGIKAISDGHTGYTPSPGIQPLRERIRQEINKRVSRSSPTRSSPSPTTARETRSSFPIRAFRSTSRRSRPVARRRYSSTCGSPAASTLISTTYAPRSTRRHGC